MALGNWGKAVSKGLEIIDSLIGISTTERKRKRRDKIQKFREKKATLVFLPASPKRSHKLADIDRRLSKLEKQAANES